MKNSLILLASFAGLVACFGEKPKEGTAQQDGQTTTETCPAEEASAPAPAVEEKKPEVVVAAPVTTETPAAEPTTAQ